MLKHEGIPVKLMAGIPFCREIIHQEIKVKKTIILTLLLITALVANGCGNKKNVTDMKDKEYQDVDPHRQDKQQNQRTRIA